MIDGRLVGEIISTLIALGLAACLFYRLGFQTGQKELVEGVNELLKEAEYSQLHVNVFGNGDVQLLEENVLDHCVIVHDPE